MTKSLRHRPASASPATPALRTVEDWFDHQGWSPFPFQQEAWRAYQAGQHGLIHASTGTGKTYAAFLGPLRQEQARQSAIPAGPAQRNAGPAVVWITPLRALSADTARALAEPIEALNIPWEVGLRTADTSSSVRRRQKERLPDVLVTTPESLSLLLTHEDSVVKFADLQCVICDEWHELLGSKRGVLTELALARLQSIAPRMQRWGVSATLANLEAALEVLLGPGRHGVVIRGHEPKSISMDTLLPERMGRFPWAGHLGLSMLPRVIERLDQVRSALVFANTRHQAETWFQAILQCRPEWKEEIALHHGSLDRRVRDDVEQRLRQGTLRCVVCTSTLDLGVDFSPVDHVLHVGSPKGVGRLLQRAGRSGHQPGQPSRITFVPTNAFELAEIAAARHAVRAGQIEGREPIPCPLDLLVQHVVSRSLAGGFQSDEFLQEIRSTHAYRHLADEQWDWALDFLTRGGKALWAYPEYRRVLRGEDGIHRVTDSAIATQHRWGIGTITSDASIQVRFLTGGSLGTVEESFLSRLHPGECFTFGGRVLELVRLHQMTAYVRKSKRPSTTIPRWMGSRLPLSTELSSAVRSLWHSVRHGSASDPEMVALAPILDIQSRWSTLPESDQLLAERIESREGYHLFLFPFEGRLVHEAMASLLAYRLSRERPRTFSMAVNDYGLELVSPDDFAFGEESFRLLLSPEDLERDTLATLNAGELAKRHFREVARVAGLVSPGRPSAHRSAKQMHASSSLFFDVFEQYDPDNLLLQQARFEVLRQQFEIARLRPALERVCRSRLVVTHPPKPTPFAFPLLVERMRDMVSSEQLGDRVLRMVKDLEREADQR